MDAAEIVAVYQLVVQGLADLGALDPQCLSRSILLHNMLYAGQVFRCEGWRAVWLLDGDSVEFHNAAGNRVKTLGLAAGMAKKAA